MTQCLRVSGKTGEKEGRSRAKEERRGEILHLIKKVFAGLMLPTCCVS